MRITGVFIIGIFLLLTACTPEQTYQKDRSNKTELTIKPYKLNAKEKELIMFTGIQDIQYFELDGSLGEEDDLQKTIEVYENGKQVENEPFSSNQMEHLFKHSLLSFGFTSDDEEKLKFIHGSEGGTFTMMNDFVSGGYTFASLLSTKTTLEKGQPIYLYAIAGTQDGQISGLSLDENGKPSGGILEADKAYVFKVTVTDREALQSTE
ncbi:MULTISPECIES: hypothetical protein [unclassified Rossellomorea]|uniref:hypothetical protein n=1 Tax=unclassified Rossellomorea TaxID=2837526 RepID=UPI002617F303|nr:hypothetical protein [uncultured Rossellomorea sp.]